ncbi:sporulation membrane protein YtrI [Neobacillus drentensis]|uniref:sporulation membrane protein YtrI n=1 Tax=Neobacillus drentensis TaxID=220684 RepID=UPI002FFE51BD
MRIPPYYRRPSWQRFFSGMVIGGAISWCIFLYIHGVWQEKYSKQILSLQDNISDLNKEKKIWQEEYKELNKRNLEKITVQKINIKITNYEKYKLDYFSIFQTEEAVRDELSIMLAKDLDTVYKSKDLLKKIIENKPLKINEKRYKLKVKEMVIYTTLSIQVELQFDE